MIRGDALDQDTSTSTCADRRRKASRRDPRRRKLSLLNPLNFIYPIGNESDLLLSLAAGSGNGLDATGQMHSEFGALPSTLTLRRRRYF